jgi:hypothetical protein
LGKEGRRTNLRWFLTIRDACSEDDVILTIIMKMMLFEL